MNEPSTRPSLLVRIRDCEDKEAWRQFVEIYAPMIYRFARRHGLQDADAADVTQEVLCDVADGARNLDYDSRRGMFRSWLYRVARNRLYKFARGQKRGHHASGDTQEQRLLQQQLSRDNGEAIWNHEYEQRVFAWAVKTVRPEFRDATWQAFWETAVNGRSGREVSKELDMSIGAVYMAKCRVLARLKEKIQEVRCAYETLPEILSGGKD